MYGLQESTWEEWKRKRRHTLIGFVLIGTSAGIDFSVFFSTLFLYLRDVVKTDRPEMWYGLIVGFFYLSSTICGIFCGRWLDRTHKVRAYVNMTLLIQILGFVLYTIPYHPLFLLVGRTICGINDPFASIVSGELFRIYDKKESTIAMFWLSSVYAIGFMIGPTLNFVFGEINFNIGPIQITYLNFIGIFMCCLLLVEIVIANLLVHNCSLQFDLKDYLKVMSENATTSVDTSDGELDSNDDQLSPMAVYSMCREPKNATETTRLIHTGPSQVDIPINIIVKTLLSNTDTLLILVATTIFTYGVFATSALFSLLVTVTLKWNIRHLSVVFVGGGACTMLILFLLAKYCKSNRAIYLTCLMCIVSQIVNLCVLICLKVLERELKRDVFLVCIFTISLTLGYSFDGVTMKVIFANMVSSKIQSFSESLRYGGSRIATVFGSFTVAAMLPWAHWWSAGVMIIYFLLLMGFIARKIHLINPMEIPFDRPTYSI